MDVWHSFEGTRAGARASPSRHRSRGAVVVLSLLWCLAAGCGRGVIGQVARGRVNNWDIREASGLAASRKHKGVLYTHNDSGDRNRIFAINEWGQYLATYDISGAEARDWEDISFGPGPDPARDYLYIGDIGDNRAYYPTKVVYRVAEPNDVPLEPSSNNYHTLTGVEKFEFRFPGHAGNANSETLLVDPSTSDLFIVRKTNDHPIQVFVARAPLREGVVIDLEEYYSTCVDYSRECRDEHHSSPSKGELVGGDISPSGLGLLIKSYRAVYYWRRKSTYDSFFDSDPRILPYVAERQGEAICWDAEEKGYFTLSEGGSPMLYYYPYQQHEKWIESAIPEELGEGVVAQWREAFDARGSASPEREDGGSGDDIAQSESASVFSWRTFSASEPRASRHAAASEAKEVRGRLLNDYIVTSEACSDIPDPSGQSCQDGVAEGKCEASWMKRYNFCKKSCGRCAHASAGASPAAEGRGGLWDNPPSQTATAGFDAPFKSKNERLEAIPVDEWWTTWLDEQSGSSAARDRFQGGAQPFVMRRTGGREGACGAKDRIAGMIRGPIVKRVPTGSADACCALCSDANDKGMQRCDAWSFCQESLGCGGLPHGTCFLKRSLGYEVRASAKWISGVGPKSKEDSIVLGVQSAPEEDIDWPAFFEDYSHNAWRQSMYLDPMPNASAAEPDTAKVVRPILSSRNESSSQGDEDWLCQAPPSTPDVLACPERKCHALRGTYKGLIVADLNMTTVAQCCEACTQAQNHKIPPHNQGCDIYTFCASQSGCGLMQPYGACSLKVTSEDPQLGLGWSFNPLEPFTSGKVETS